MQNTKKLYHYWQKMSLPKSFSLPFEAILIHFPQNKILYTY